MRGRGCSNILTSREFLQVVRLAGFCLYRSPGVTKSANVGCRERKSKVFSDPKKSNSKQFQHNSKTPLLTTNDDCLGRTERPKVYSSPSPFRDQYARVGFQAHKKAGVTVLKTGADNCLALSGGRIPGQKAIGSPPYARRNVDLKVSPEAARALAKRSGCPDQGE